MAKEKRFFGIYKVLLGDVQADGTMPDEADMVEVGELVYDSIAFDYEENSIVDIKNQETGKVDLSVVEEEGSKKFTFSTRNMKFENMILAFGGEVVDGVWNAPLNTYNGVEKALKVVLKAPTGLHAVTDFPRVNVIATFQGAVVENATTDIVFSCTALTPSNESTGEDQSMWQVYYKPAAPTNGVVDNTADTFAFDYVIGFTSASDYEYSIDGGSGYTDCTANPITGLTGAIAVGDLLVRVKANTSNQHVAGYTLANKEAFTA